MAKTKKAKTITRWALKSVTLDDHVEMQKMLDTGYEPFCIITKFMPASRLDPKAQNGIIPVNLVFFKLSYEIPVDAQGKEIAQTIIAKEEVKEVDIDLLETEEAEADISASLDIK